MLSRVQTPDPKMWLNTLEAKQDHEEMKFSIQKLLKEKKVTMRF